MKKILTGTIYVIECPNCKWHKANVTEYRKNKKTRYKCTRCKSIWWERANE